MKLKTFYICNNCGAKSAKWSGQCSNCGAWNTLIEEKEQKVGKIKISKKEIPNLINFDDVDVNSEPRLKTGIVELDRVLGGGIVSGSFVLIGGDPGIGKSTLMLQMVSALNEHNPLYISGEESLSQVKIRARRLKGNFDKLLLMTETDVEKIYTAIKNSESNIIIVDSIQSIYHNNIESAPGSVSQIRECASLLLQLAKSTGKAIFIVGHVNKDGFIAGPKVLEHTVDTVLQFEGERNYSFRILRALKNRFGATNEIGIFEMVESGLKEVSNPSEVFLTNRVSNESGVCIVSAIEGSRPILVEVQSLVSPTSYGVPQRTVNGYDTKRLQMILAVLEKRLGARFGQFDVFVNIAGGLSVNDPAIDLGIAISLMSSFREEPVDREMIAIGEIGLTGEIRNISQINQRVKEAAKLGFKKVLLPTINDIDLPKSLNIELIKRNKLYEAVQLIFG